ncbi:DnaD domain-containing protein [Bacillus sp. FJAT-45037]|uniref:DnaD domain-containing protein n=1 Tax=Bacillus sp. FJAT-45037 TaxID=2011007 RepID=UPI000C24A358|nr:DnaD domain protein [Bacillus sp. FJAT-45037]
MNYEQQLNAFYDQLETKPLSAAGIAVWHALMQVYKKAGWKTPFTVAVSVVTIKAGISERHFYLVRQELVEKGYLTYESRKGRQAAIYFLTALTEPYTHNTAVNRTYNADNSTAKSTHISTHNRSPLVNELNNKELNKDINNNNNPFRFYEENGFGMLSPFISESINAWLIDHTFREPEAVLIEAMKIALMQNVRTWNYVRKVLQDWSEKGIQTVADVQAEQERRKLKVATHHTKKTGKQAQVPTNRSNSSDYPSYDFGF